MKKVILYGALSLFILILLGLILLPGIVKRYAISHSPELIGRSIELNKLKVNYLGGKIRIFDFVMYEANQKDLFISFDTLMVDLKPLRLIKKEFIMQQFYLSGLSTYMIQEDSLFNFSDLITYHSPKDGEVEKEMKDTATSEAFKYELSEIDVRRSRFSFENRNLEDTLLIEDLSFFIPYLGWNQEDRSDAKVRFLLEKDGYIEAGIQVHPMQGDFDLSLVISSLNLEGMRNYAAELAEIGSLKGVFNTRLDIAGNYNMPEQSVVSGMVEIRDLYLEDRNKKQFLGAESIRTRIGELDPHNSSFQIDSLTISKPYIYFELKDSTNNFVEILSNTPASADSVELPDTDTDSISRDSSNQIYYIIQTFNIKEGQIDFTDLTTGQDFHYALSEVEINSEGIESTADWVRIYASMLLNQRGKLVAETGFNPLNTKELVFDYTITDFQLSDLHIYSTHFVGFPVVYGEMYYKGHTELKNYELISDNKLILDQVTLGEKRGGLLDLPLKFALFILKDRNGVIDLDIPVRGDTKDPKVKVGTIVWNTLKNLIIKTAAAPFDFLAGMIGVDPKDVESIEYAYMDTTLTDGRQKQLDMLLELEQIKEGLEIELLYFNDLDLEKNQITLELVGASTTDTLENAPGMREVGRIDSIADLFTSVRLAQIEGYLFAQNDSTEIQVYRSDTRAPQNVGSNPRFEVKYSVKEAELDNSR